MKTSLDLAVLLGFQKKYVLDRFITDPAYSILVSLLEDMIIKIQSSCDKNIRLQASYLFHENKFDVVKYKEKIECERTVQLQSNKRALPSEYFSMPDRQLRFKPAFCPDCKSKDSEIEKLKKQLQEKDKRIHELEEQNNDLTGSLALCEYEKCQMKEVEYKLKAQLARGKIKYVPKYQCQLVDTKGTMKKNFTR